MLFGAMQSLMADGIRNWPQIGTSGYWLPTQMYYNLYLYYHVLENDPLFYQKLFRNLRKSPMKNGAGSISANVDYLHFARMASDAAGEDLSDFFEYWGFFEPCTNVKAASYSTWYLTCTQADIDATLEYMSKYPKANASMCFIDDYVNNYTKGNYYDDLRNDRGNAIWGAYKDFAAEDEAANPTNFSYTMTTAGKVTIPNTAKGGAAGVKVRDANGKLIYIAAARSFTIPSNLIDKVATITLSLVDGTEIPLYKTTEEGVYKINVYQGNNTPVVRYTKGNDAAFLSSYRDGDNAIVMLDADDTAAAAALGALINVADADGNVQQLALTDADDFYAPVELKAATATYTRKNVLRGFDAVCLPFALTSEDLPEGYFVETIARCETSGTKMSVVFEKNSADLPAGTPALLYTPEPVESHVISKTNVTVPTEAKTVSTTDGAATFNGSFAAKPATSYQFLLDHPGLTFSIVDEGSLLPAFRSYLEVNGTSAIQLKVTHPEIPTNVEVPVFTDSNKAPIYDLQGRRVNAPAKGGIYIQNGRKLVF